MSKQISDAKRSGSRKAVKWTRYPTVILGVIPEFIPVLRLLTISAGLQLLR
jgi:hypothetical protein